MSCALVLSTSCAKPVTPTGGDQDVTPPRILSAEPDNESILYSGSGITLDFDEFVQLKNASKELIVSPPLKHAPEFKLKGKKLNIEWTDTLHENTTYLFQFGAGIVDLNEGNALDSNVFVFSTGAYIDSFELKGKVILSEDLSPQKDIWVMLYHGADDSLPYLELPDYFSKTDANGEFHFRYLQQGDYKIFALNPENVGYLFDIPEEAIGFLEVRVAAHSPRDTASGDSLLRVGVFTQLDSSQFIQRSKQLNNHGVAFKFNRPVDTLCIREFAGKDSAAWIPQWNSERDSVIYWFNEPRDYDSLRLELIYEDQWDTIFFRKPQQGGGRKGGKKPMDANVLALKSSTTERHPHFEPWVAMSTTPLQREMRFSHTLFVEQTDTVDIQPYLKINDGGITLDYPWKTNTRYVVLLADSFVCDRFRRCNDSTQWVFTTSRKEDYGQLLMKYQLPANGHPYVWQLLDPVGKVAEERSVTSSGSVEYPFLMPGKYRVKLVFDENGNGKWDTGNYPDHKQPERVKYFNETIEVRSNWFSEFEWKLTK